VSKIETTISDNFKTVRNRMPVTINHQYKEVAYVRSIGTKSVTLNDLQRRNTRIFHRIW